MEKIFEDDKIFMVKHNSQIPWVKIFTQKKHKELTECDMKTKQCIYKIIEITEKAMLEFYKPEKINIAMFGNYFPHFHVHIMARFKDDDYFPEPMWGKKQRDGKLHLLPFDEFVRFLKLKLEAEILA